MLINSNLTNKIVGIQGKSGKITTPVPTTKKSSGRELLIGALMALASLSPANASAGTNNTTTVSNTPETVTNPINRSVKAEKAHEMNLSATANSNIYYSKENSVYYKWDNKKQKFSKDKNISTIYKSGYIKTKNGEYLTPEGNWLAFRRDSWNLTSNLWNKSVDFAVATAKGYKATDLAEQINYNAIKGQDNLKLFYDSDNNKYYTWNNNRQDLTESPITDVSGMYYTKDNKHYKLDIKDRTATSKEVSEEEYQASKQGFKGVGRKGVYESKKNCDGYYYSWDKATQKFKPFGDKYDKEQMLVQKADGEIGNFRQGDIGDCWILGMVNGMNHHPDKKLREKLKKVFAKSVSIDENENITITLRGPKKEYTFSKEDIDSVLQTPNYHYSIGERDVVAVEMALEAYKREMRNVGKNPRLADNIYYMQRRPFQCDDDYVLDGGQSYDAIHLLTGMESHFLRNGYFDKCMLSDNKIIPGKLNEDLLKKYLNSDNLVLVNYKDKSDDTDGHVVVLTGIDNQNVYVIDSNIDDNNPDKTVHPVARNKKEFLEKMSGITYSDFSTPISEAKKKQIKAKYEITPEAKPLLPKDFKI